MTWGAINMEWAKPRFSRKRVAAAGQVLIGATDGSDMGIDNALKVVNNFRSSHSFPLNTFQATLRKKARSFDGTSIIAQRIKRLSSIELKLKRFDWLNNLYRP